MKRSILIINALFIVLVIGAKELGDYQGINIKVSTSEPDQGLQISGALSVFVNCGSQYATWNQFPGTILYILKDLDNDVIYKSNDTELSISWDGNNVYEEYAKEPCDRIVTKEFSTRVSSIYFNQAPETEISNFELEASYLGFSSNTLVIKNNSIILNSTVGDFPGK